ncbi:MAG: DUF4400 domain-containing protein [Candidatus Thiodiazotropha lotti]|nr:DUF4400 domain-containing protein [Candidatus Thiodiazotropha lotti]
MPSQSDNSRRGKLAKAILFAMICIILVLFLAPPAVLQSAFAQEREITADLVGYSNEEKIHSMSDRWNRSLVDREAWHAGARNIELPLTHHNRLASYLEDRVEAAAALIEIGCYRLASIGIWLMLALPLFIAVVVDAVMTRKVRQHQFRYVSHTLQFASGTAIGVVVALLLAGLFIPYPLPYTLTAFLGIPLAWLIWNWVANLPKRI